MPSMPLDNGMGRGQAKTTAVGFGGEIRVEDLLEVFGRNTTTLICDGEPDVWASGVRKGDALQGDIDCLYLESAALWHRLSGIARQLMYDLFDLVFVGLDRPQILCKDEVALHVWSAKAADNFL
jgi:hypothetical protein